MAPIIRTRAATRDPPRKRENTKKNSTLRFRAFVLSWRSSLCGHRCDQRLDIPERERESLQAIDALDLRHVVRHQHAVVADLFVNARRLQHVDAAVVDERFTEVEEAALDVAEVDAEDLLARAEVADDVEDLLARLLELLGHGALTEVEAVVGALLDRDEFLQAIRRTEHRIDAAPAAAFRDAGILRMAPHLHLILLGHRDDLLEEVGDALPI